MADEEFENTDAGASQTEKVESQRLKSGSLVMMKGFPCKVTDVSTAKPGKHGSAKVILKGKDIFTDKQYEETFGTGDMIPAPVVVNTEYTCIDCNEDGVLMLLTKEGEMKEDLSLPTAGHLKDLGKQVRAIIEAGKKECLVRVQKWDQLEQAIAVREGNDQ